MSSQEQIEEKSIGQSHDAQPQAVHGCLLKHDSLLVFTEYTDWGVYPKLTTQYHLNSA